MLYENLKFSISHFKYIILIILIFFIFKSIFLDLYLKELNFYIEIYLMPMYAYFNLSLHNFLFGIPVDAEINDFTINHEWGLFETLILSGFFPTFIFILILSYIYFNYKKIKNNLFENDNHLFLIRTSVIIIFFCFFSLIHYSSIFNPGFFQLMGLHLGFLLNTFDESKDKSI